MEIISTCYFCNQSSENIDHIFQICTFTQGICEHIKYNCPTPLFYESSFLSCLESINKKYKTHCKFFKQPMGKVSIIIWSIWTHSNQVVFKKIKPNPFLIIKKASSTFQNLHECVILILSTKDVMSLVKLKDGFDGSLLLMKYSN